jgi:hypothetical protein
MLLWAAISTAVMLAWWILVYVTIRENPFYALAYPLGALVLLYIFLTAVIRGRRVTWKGRTYIAR